MLPLRLGILGLSLRHDALGGREGGRGERERDSGGKNPGNAMGNLAIV